MEGRFSRDDLLSESPLSLPSGKSCNSAGMPPGSSTEVREADFWEERGIWGEILPPELPVPEVPTLVPPPPDEPPVVLVEAALASEPPLVFSEATAELLSATDLRDLATRTGTIIKSISSGTSSPNASNSGNSTKPIKRTCEPGRLTLSGSIKGVTGRPSDFSAALWAKNSCSKRSNQGSATSMGRASFEISATLMRIMQS
ncbi:hypothetical protein FF38_09231 [Lucilia cuprina]|uniref:Uncharacterized protein n=1 Tax=Lucilia cuprina TaxID=7375 RepID=A0A0L0C8B0_LUCCU|nr:hypothetical protein FF38_09231 [Lucilia cuprina]